MVTKAGGAIRPRYSDLVLAVAHRPVKTKGPCSNQGVGAIVLGCEKRALRTRCCTCGLSGEALPGKVRLRTSCRLVAAHRISATYRFRCASQERKEAGQSLRQFGIALQVRPHPGACRTSGATNRSGLWLVQQEVFPAPEQVSGAHEELAFWEAVLLNQLRREQSVFAHAAPRWSNGLVSRRAAFDSQHGLRPSQTGPKKLSAFGARSAGAVVRFSP